MTDGSNVLLLSNYSRTGIGDFGQELRSRLKATCPELLFEETSPKGVTGYAQELRVLRYPGTLIASIGLTSWGTSPVRNFTGFASLGARARLGKPTVVLLHNAIEVIDQKSSGYSFGRMTERGAHLAVASVRGCSLVVFSKTLADVLSQYYGFSPTVTTPIPSSPPRGRVKTRVQPPIILTPGYLSPYKGLETIPQVKEFVKGSPRFVVAGGPHRLLLEDYRYSKFLSRATAALQTSGVTMTGYLENDQLDDLVSASTLGFLPYISTQGGTAMFARLATGGLPVVAPNLPEFEWLRTLGAGVETCPPSPQAFGKVINELLSDASQLDELARRQERFAETHSWDRFVNQLGELASESTDSVRGYPRVRPVL